MPEFMLTRWLKLPIWARILIGVPLFPVWALGSAAALILMFVAFLTVMPVAYGLIWLITGEEPG
jgi:hypothetical protein